MHTRHISKGKIIFLFKMHSVLKYKRYDTHIIYVWYNFFLLHSLLNLNFTQKWFYNNVNILYLVHYIILKQRKLYCLSSSYYIIFLVKELLLYLYVFMNIIIQNLLVIFFHYCKLYRVCCICVLKFYCYYRVVT